MEKHIDIRRYDYTLPEERIAKYPLEERDASKLLLYGNGTLAEDRFRRLGEHLPPNALLVFNNTRVVRARLVFFKDSGARIEIFCLEPHEPADYERAFARKGRCRWRCLVGNSKKWKEDPLRTVYGTEEGTFTLTARRIESGEKEPVIEFAWTDPAPTFGQLLETLGRIPIPPYLNRESEESDNTRYQTVYAKREGSVAAPTAGLHFTDRVLEDLQKRGMATEEVTLHVGAGTFLPVKEEDAARHVMHAERFEVRLPALRALLTHADRTVAVGTTSVRTLESLSVLGYRVLQTGDPQAARPVGQWEAYDIPDGLSGTELLSALAAYLEKEGLDRLSAVTRIMIVPGYRFRFVSRLVTNFHQPKSTLLLLISAFIGEDWRRVYDYALEHGFRFLSYGDSSLLTRKQESASPDR